MKVVSTLESREQCTVMGWRAYDLFLDEEVDESLARRLGDLGDFVYLGELRSPFFKVDTPTSSLRGIVGRDSIRVSGCRESIDDFMHTVIGSIQRPRR
jgi:hypothetical protein